MADWTFLSDHAHVLVELAREPRSTPAAVAKATGIDADAVSLILRDLEQGGYIRREREGGTEFTFIDRQRPLRHNVERHHPVGRLLDAVESPADTLRDRLAAMD
jgi:DNA-binding IclR family transcriptional regulator